MKSLLKEVSYFSFVLILLLISSCESEQENISENEIHNVELTDVEIIKQNFSLENFNDTTGFLEYNLKVMWDSHVENNIDGTIWHEFQIEEQIKTNVEKGEITDITYSLLSTLNAKGTPMYRLVKMASHNGDAYSSYFDLVPNNFTGMTYIYDMNGDMTMTRYYRKGTPFRGIVELESQVPGPVPSSLTARCDAKIASKSYCDGASNCREPNQTGGCEGPTGGGQYVWTRTGSYATDWYNDANADGVGQSTEYSHTQQGGDIYEWVWVNDGGSAPAPQNSYSYHALDGYSSSVNEIPKPSISPIRTYVKLPPSCRSFNFVQDRVSSNQVAAVVNVSFKIVYVDRYNVKKSTFATFLQPIYFTIPRFHSEHGNLLDGRGANRVAKALGVAHKRTKAYFIATGASQSQVQSKAWEYIRDELRNGTYMTGGVASFTPPLAGFDGEITQYETTSIFYDDCTN
ncbi:hypothetical protein [Flagellimonas sp. S3867]|uniref:hypothetical protein n=1 Tax=Flagellimonas sp. S3867 TaxID=2768063 RepID=UPI001681FC0D|nr:hypothetical protein [Flagellimonas sp. S3867]